MTGAAHMNGAPVLSGVSLTAIPGLPEIAPGDDLAAIMGDALAGAGLPLQDGDILCVAQKIVSKAEDCLIAYAGVTPSAQAQDLAQQLNKDPRKVEIVLRESRRVIRVAKHIGGGLVNRHLSCAGRRIGPRARMHLQRVETIGRLVCHRVLPQKSRAKC